MKKGAFNLPPEYSSAVEVLYEFLPQLQATPTEYILPSIFQQGSIQMFNGSVIPRSIPCHDKWRWNQSKPRRTITLENGSRVDVMKLIPRRRSLKSTHDIPSYKLWLYHVISNSTHRPTLSIVWCEKGVTVPMDLTSTENGHTPPSSPIEYETSQNEPRVEDYEFLAAFMSRHTAAEIWPQCTLLDCPLPDLDIPSF